jgi:hypothetical protein
MIMSRLQPNEQCGCDAEEIIPAKVTKGDTNNLEARYNTRDDAYTYDQGEEKKIKEARGGPVDQMCVNVVTKPTR